ncbi:MAG TPA: hypothetical protein PKI66_08940 [Methanobacteriaceae archaeon]|nr:hypothetical protein [Methanobacteriaceae archaeon]HNS24851.1 hypothetical protein [Methanobacteriaceae archaeon]
MHISPMREEHLEQMVELDLLAFNRKKPRLLESGGVNGHGPPWVVMLFWIMNKYGGKVSPKLWVAKDTWGRWGFTLTFKARVWVKAHKKRIRVSEKTLPSHRPGDAS